jgi:ketosteroid isomerase-like protein
MLLAVTVMSLTLGTPAPAAKPETPTQLSPVHLPAELARVLTDYEAAWRVGNGAALAQLFHPDGFVLPNGDPPFKGRAAIQQYYQGHGGPLVLRALAFATEGTVGYIIGGFARQEGQPDVGKFTLTLRKDADSRWFIFSDMDNGNQRPR